uniref:Uncharacterized protein n=1 Tax=Arundo donax TaxID=35708 RepID=A0A0A8Y4L4_ARUDO
MAKINQGKIDLHEVSKQKDGMGLADHLKNTEDVGEDIAGITTGHVDNFTLHLPRKRM